MILLMGLITNVGPTQPKISPYLKMIQLFMITQKKTLNILFLGPVDDLEIIRTVQNCKNERSTDFSDISMSVLKKVISKIVKPFAHICNVSFQKGVFPKQK